MSAKIAANGIRTCPHQSETCPGKEVAAIL